MSLFEDTQKLSGLWNAGLLVLLLIFSVLYILADRFFLIGVILCGLFVTFSMLIRFELKVYEDRIEYKLFPFHKTYRILMLTDVQSFRIIRAKKMGIYGFKIKSTPTGEFYHLCGGKVLHINVCSGKDIYIGTQRIKEIQEVLNI